MATEGRSAGKVLLESGVLVLISLMCLHGGSRAVFRGAQGALWAGDGTGVPYPLPLSLPLGFTFSFLMVAQLLYCTPSCVYSFSLTIG